MAEEQGRWRIGNPAGAFYPQEADQRVVNEKQNKRQNKEI